MYFEQKNGERNPKRIGPGHIGIRRFLDLLVGESEAIHTWLILKAWDEDSMWIEKNINVLCQ